MQNPLILLVDTLRSGDSADDGLYPQFQESADQLSVTLDIIQTPETALRVVVESAAGREHLQGIVLLRSVSSTVLSPALETSLGSVSVPVVELFLETDLGRHPRIDQAENGRKIIRTIYGRQERGIFWAMHFLLHCRDHPYRTFHYGPLDSQIGDLMLPTGPGPHPVVMLIHGGFWRDGYYRDSTHGIAADLAGRGLAVWNVEYRRVGPSGGGYPETHQDVLQALNFLKELANQYPINTERTAVVGHSAGGYLSTWAGSLPKGPMARIMPVPKVPVRLSISLAGVTDLDEAHLHGGGEQAATHFLKEAAEDPELRRQLSTAYLTYAPVTRLLLVHGTLDEYVPVELSKHTWQLLRERGGPGELVILPGTGHNEFVDPDTEVWGDLAGRIVDILRA